MLPCSTGVTTCAYCDPRLLLPGPFPRMQVSNLPGANDATRTLRDMLLRSRAAGMPCTLVYNTGR